MPNITVNLFEGRTIETKRELAKEITEVVCKVCEVPAEAVTVKFEEMARHDYAKAGVLMSDK